MKWWRDFVFGHRYITPACHIHACMSVISTEDQSACRSPRLLSVLSHLIFLRQSAIVSEKCQVNFPINTLVFTFMSRKTRRLMMKTVRMSLLPAVCIPMSGIGTSTAQDAKPAIPKADTLDVWIPTMVTAWNSSQIAFSNWTRGGSNALAWTATANIGYNYKGAVWGMQNHLRASYGRNKTGA